jgi:RsiW-degrading membrane proteinase PrsW (M82 family)
MHWGFALASGIVFLSAILMIFPRRREEVSKILLVTAFTATVGIFLLLAFQWIASATEGVWLRGRGIVMIFFYIAKFIAYSYSAALEPANGFIASFFGFTLGVGLCEELCKALPLLYRYRTAGELTIKTACLWGLASGVGFGVSEGISYSSDFYNGISGGEIYLVRFLSCVALHAVWSGAVAVTIHRQQHLIHHSESWWELLGYAVLIILVPMVLHGLYDTLLKKDYPGLALVVAIASFGWLMFQIEAAWRIYGDVEEGGSAEASARAAACFRR